MVELKRFASVVSHIHAAATEAGRWDAALVELTDLLGATACTVALGTGSDRSILSTTICDDAVAAYTSYFHEQDFVMEVCESGPVGELRGGAFPEHRKTEYFTDWQQRFDMTDGLFVRMSASGPSSFIVGAPTRSQPFGTAERVQVVEALVPHIQQAMTARAGILATGGRAQDIREAADVIRHSIFVVAAGGRIVQMNAAARRLVAVADSLQVHGSVLQASLAAVNNQLQAGLAQALVRRDSPLRTSSHLVCERRSGRRPLVLYIVPLERGDDPALARAAIVAVDPDHQVEPPKLLLKNLFGFTDAESHVALRMLRGEEPKVIAETATVTIATVRSHIHRILYKTGTRRQADLIRLLASLVP